MCMTGMITPPGRYPLCRDRTIRASVMYQALLSYDVLPADADTTAGRSTARQVIPVVPRHSGGVHLDQRPSRQCGCTDRAEEAAA